MTKKEIIWREILSQVIEKKNIRFTQKELAKKLKVSLSTVFNALKSPRQASAIEVRGRYFLVRDKEKLLYLWASIRNLNKEIIYQTHVEGDVQNIESELPPEIIFATYSAYRQVFKEVPADYDKVYVYSDKVEEIKKRFPENKGYINLIVLKSDKHLKKYGPVTPLAQIFVDLWNLPEWYAKDFLNVLKEKILCPAEKL
ncbi:MAG: hypothetical protein COX43_01060 [Parcubacteria group bacterium CG23_combo_of_CG06-09_8_20_14_all_35_9]|nr:MAG: hypothetical protein COX43_01060 [Parcubacteria group bacterium CG23_combo_of_CG06-09_8_20_14_all_35_9]